MSITVNQIVLHQLVKNVDGDSIKMESVLRDELLSITPEVEQMMLQLHQGYQNKAKAFWRVSGKVYLCTTFKSFIRARN